MNANARFLLERFLERLLSLRPRSVLDVGCGRGALLDGLREGGVPAWGLEVSLECLQAARELGHRVVRADARHLPLAERSVDWVAIRHVMHHLADPRSAMAEAVRVARSGILVAEPWHERSRPDHETARRIDAWLKRQDRRLGRFHGDDHSLDELAAMLPEPARWRLAREIHLREERRRIEEVRAEMEPSVEGLAEDAPERRAFDELLAEAERTGVGSKGTAILVARRASTPMLP